MNFDECVSSDVMIESIFKYEANIVSCENYKAKYQSEIPCHMKMHDEIKGNNQV